MSGKITLRTTLIHVLDKRGELEAGLCLSIDGFVDQLLSTVFFPAALLYLGFDRRLESFTKVTNERGLFWSPVNIKLDKDGLKMFEVGRPILNFLLLVLGVSLNSAPNGVHEKPQVSKTFS